MKPGGWRSIDAILHAIPGPLVEEIQPDAGEGVVRECMTWAILNIWIVRRRFGAKSSHIMRAAIGVVVHCK